MNRIVKFGNSARWGGLIAALLVGLLAARSEAAGLLVADGGFGGALENKQHDVHVTINNGIAVTEIDQVFLNKENRIVECCTPFRCPRTPRCRTSACGSMARR